MGIYSKVYVDSDTGETAVFDESIFQGGISTILVNVATPSEIWTIVHNKNSNQFLCEIVDENDEVMVPQNVVIDDNNTIVITFTVAVSGKATLVFFE